MRCNPLACVCGPVTLPQRHFLCFMAFLAVLFSYTMRTCLHIAITEMVVPSTEKKGEAGVSVCPDTSHPVEVKGGSQNWSDVQQGAILAAFFPGYVISHVPGGLMADKYGAKHVLSVGVAVSAVFTILTPPVVELGGDWWSVVIIRFIIGFCQGPLYPCITTLLARWAPPSERTTLGGFVNMGNQIGSICGNLLSGYIMAHVNWHLVFYFWGAISGAWYVVFILCCYSVPEKHPFITREEAEMLEREIGHPQRMEVPWKKILKDPVLWALFVGQAGHDLIYFTIVVELPQYLKNVLKFNIKENAMLNSIPYLALWICGMIAGPIADYTIKNGLVSVLRVRQCLTVIGNILPGICIIAASLMGCHRIGASAMFILGMFFMGPFFCGMKVNVLDVSKNFSGIVMGIVNGLGSLMFVPVPYVIPLLAPNQTIDEWRWVFIGMLIITVVTTILYVMFTSADRAEWDKPEE